MVMKFTPSPTFIVCDTKVFQPKELHCTRLYNRSVLILMMDGELRFREDGKLFTLLPGEYYIQRNGLLQEGVPMDKPPIYFWIEFHASYSEDAIGLPLRGTFRMLNVVPLIERMEDLFHHHRADPFKLNSYMLRIFSELLSSSNYIDEKQYGALGAAVHQRQLSLPDHAEQYCAKIQLQQGLYHPDFQGAIQNNAPSIPHPGTDGACQMDAGKYNSLGRSDRRCRWVFGLFRLLPMLPKNLWHLAGSHPPAGGKASPHYTRLNSIKKQKKDCVCNPFSVL